MSVVTQWALLRLATLPKFENMFLLHEFNGGDEKVQMYAHYEEVEGEQVYSIYWAWELYDITVRVGRLMLLTSKVNAAIAHFNVPRVPITDMVDFFKQAVHAEYELGMSLITHIVAVGDYYLGGYQIYAVETFEARQQQLAIDVTGEDMVVSGGLTDVQTLDRPIDTPPEPIDPVSDESFASFHDAMQNLFDDEKGDNEDEQ